MVSACLPATAAASARRRAQGRPLGLMVAWLMTAGDHATKEGHWDRSQWPNHQVRSEAREALAAMPGGLALMEHERTQEAGEAPEPDGLA